MAKTKRIPWNKGKKDTRKYIYYTDGKINLRVLENTPCPEGFHRGRIKRESTVEELKRAKEKYKKTCLEKYGCEYASQAKKVKDKIKASVFEKYGVNCSFEAAEVKEKAKATSRKRYGTDYPQSAEETKDKRKTTCIEKYGVDNYAKTEECKKKTEETCLKKYGVKNSRQRPEMTQHYKELEEQSVQKCIDTKRKNKTFNTSKPEDAYYEKLVKSYGKENIIRQYSDSRYPFACDFYIKPTDTFIELNLSWTHGGHLFNESSADDQNKLHEWTEKSKTSEYYRNAITTWTVRDVEKNRIAIENKLNYITIYDLKE